MRPFVGDVVVSGEAVQQRYANAAAGWASGLALPAPAVKRAAWLVAVAVIAGIGVAAALLRPFDGYDFGVYRLALSGWPDELYRCSGGCYRYAPGFMLIFAPFGALPPDVGVLLWRLVSLAALAASVWGLGPIAFAILLFPAVVADLAVANVSTFALACAIALVRWPSARTLALYTTLIVLVPKPVFLPVLVWGFLTIPTGRPAALIIGVAGLGQLIWPGYLQGLGTADRIVATTTDMVTRLPAWLIVASLTTAAILTVLAVRWPRLLGPASVLASPYWYPYVFVPLALSLVASRKRRPQATDNG